MSTHTCVYWPDEKTFEVLHVGSLANRVTWDNAHNDEVLCFFCGTYIKVEHQTSFSVKLLNLAIVRYRDGTVVPKFVCMECEYDGAYTKRTTCNKKGCKFVTERLPDLETMDFEFMSKGDFIKSARK